MVTVQPLIGTARLFNNTKYTLQRATACLKAAMAVGGKVLVHCMHGMNRGAIVAMAVQMNIEGVTLQQEAENTH